MKPSELLKQISVLLSAEAKVELAQVTTADGVVLEAEAFEVGKEIFVVSETETVPAENGEYKVDGMTIIVLDGKIDSIVEVEAETEIEVEAAEEVKPTEDVKVEAVSQEEIIKAVVEAIAPMLEEMKAQITEMKSEMENYKQTKMSKVTHSPEKVVAQKSQTNLNKQTNVLETIFAKLN